MYLGRTLLTTDPHRVRHNCARPLAADAYHVPLGSVGCIRSAYFTIRVPCIFWALLITDPRCIVNLLGCRRVPYTHLGAARPAGRPARARDLPHFPLGCDQGADGERGAHGRAGDPRN